MKYVVLPSRAKVPANQCPETEVAGVETVVRQRVTGFLLRFGICNVVIHRQSRWSSRKGPIGGFLPKCPL